MQKRLILFIAILCALGLGLFTMRHFQGGNRAQSRPGAIASGSAQSGEVASPEAVLNFAKSMNSPLVLVNFWASWCEPCKKEMPALKQIAMKYREQGLRIILVSIDEAEEMDIATNYLQEEGIDFPSFFKGDQPLKFVAKIFPQWSGAVPASLILGPDLKILDSWEGDSTFEELDQRVREHLKGS